MIQYRPELPHRPMRFPYGLAAGISIALLAVVPFGCGLRSPRSTDEIERVKIFLISADGGLSDCRGDRPVALEVALPRRQPALEGAFASLLARKDRFDTRSGLLHALYPSPLRLRAVERNGQTARLHLDGYLELGGACDAARVRLQLERTALQFRDLRQVEIDVAGRPLDELLAPAERRPNAGG